MKSGVTYPKRAKGFVLMFATTRLLFPLDENLHPVVFKTRELALQHITDNCPSWGRSAVSVYTCEVKPGANGKPDYMLGDVVANGTEAT